MPVLRVAAAHKGEHRPCHRARRGRRLPQFARDPLDVGETARRRRFARLERPPGDAAVYQARSLLPTSRGEHRQLAVRSTARRRERVVDGDQPEMSAVAETDDGAEPRAIATASRESRRALRSGVDASSRRAGPATRRAGERNSVEPTRSVQSNRCGTALKSPQDGHCASPTLSRQRCSERHPDSLDACPGRLPARTDPAASSLDASQSGLSCHMVCEPSAPMSNAWSGE